MYVKLFASILKSSVWDESPTTRIVWITFLLEADEHGFVKGVERGLARLANVTPEQFRAAVEVLEADDIESQDQDFGGRRIEKVEGGWQVLNYTKYREIRTREQVREAEKKQRQRARAKESAPAKSLSENAVAPAADAAAAVVPGHVPDVPPIASASASESGGRGAGGGDDPALRVLQALADKTAADVERGVHGVPLHAAEWSDAHWRAYAALAAKHGDRAGLDLLLAEACAAGWTSATLGQALVELREAGARVSRLTLLPFAKRIQQRGSAALPAPPALPIAAPKGWCSACTGTALEGHRRGCPFGVADQQPAPRAIGVRIGAAS